MISPALTFKSISGYRDFDDEEPTDFDGTPIAWADFNVYQSLETFSQELQLLGSAFDDRIKFVTGLYYYDEKAEVRAPGVFGFGTVKQEPQFKTNNSSWAAYGQVDWRPDILDRRADADRRPALYARRARDVGSPRASSMTRST